MKQTKNNHTPLPHRIADILFGILLAGIFCYGTLLLALGLWEHHTLQSAKASFTAVPVCVTEISAAEADDVWRVVTLEPLDAKAKDRLGITCTTVVRPQQSEGDILTMYYDPNEPQTRIVDFENTAALLLRGTLCTAIPCAFGMLWLFLRYRRKKRRPPTVIIRSGES